MSSGSTGPTAGQCTSTDFRRMRTFLAAMLCPTELGILGQHIPALFLLHPEARTAPPPSVPPSEAVMRTLFGVLLRALAAGATGPVLFFADDLQWADPLSLGLLAALARGTQPNLSRLLSGAASVRAGSRKGSAKEAACGDGDVVKEQRHGQHDVKVMFVGSYRENDVPPSHPLAKTLAQFRADSSLTLTDISLAGFSLDTLSTMLSDMLHLPVRRICPLAKMIQQKTDGRPLHVIEFLRGLLADGLLTHSFDRGWEWDADSITICPISDDVAQLFSLKLHRLPQKTLHGLQVLSCFGSQVDLRVLRLAADCDTGLGCSMDIIDAVRVATREGLVESAGQLVRFSHDIIQKAALDSIGAEELGALLRKLAAGLSRNVTASGESEDSVLFVAVDLVNRIGGAGGDAAGGGSVNVASSPLSPEERVLFAKMNSRAGTKALMVPDFAAAARYANAGISLLSDTCWESHYELSLQLYETAVLSHFSSLEGGRNRLLQQIDVVARNARSFADRFRTQCVWIKLLSMTELGRAIDESLQMLVRLGKPLDLQNVDTYSVREELKAKKKLFQGKRKKELFLEGGRLSDDRAMKVLAQLTVYYYMQGSFMVSYVSCTMMEMSMNSGHCSDSVFAAAAFASSLVNVLGDIDEGSAWARMSLSLMTMYDMEMLIPSIHGSLYGIVLLWKEPMQSTLEPLALGIRLSFATGNMQFAMVNTIYYVARSFNCGKNIHVLAGEVEALARQHANHFGLTGVRDSCTSSDKPMNSPLLQYYLTPLYNTLCDLEGREDDNQEPPFFVEKIKFVNNCDILNAALEMKQRSSLHTVLSYETARAFISRDMENALKFTNIYAMHFVHNDISYTPIYNVLYEALINLYYMRLRGEEHHLVRGENALKQIETWSKHSEWNFQNKLLLVSAEWHYTKQDFDKAAACYKSSVETAREHKFIHEEALACELAGIFFIEIGDFVKAKLYYLRSMECFNSWGAFTVAKRVECIILNTFGSIKLESTADPCFSLLCTTKKGPSKKRQLNINDSV